MVSPVNQTCATCPFARHLDGDRYVCCVDENQSTDKVVRGHWAAQTEYLDAMETQQTEEEILVGDAAPKDLELVFRISGPGQWTCTTDEGRQYQIKTVEGEVTNCSCKGYSYRHTCRHAKELERRINLRIPLAPILPMPSVAERLKRSGAHEAAAAVRAGTTRVDPLCGAGKSYRHRAQKSAQWHAEVLRK